VEQNGRAHPSLRLCGSAAGLRHSCGRPGLRSAAALRHRRTLFPDQRIATPSSLIRTRLLHWLFVYFAAVIGVAMGEKLSVSRSGGAEAEQRKADLREKKAAKHTTRIRMTSSTNMLK